MLFGKTINVQFLTLFLVLFLFFAVSFPAFAADYYRVDIGDTVKVDEHGVCKMVTNNGSLDIFVPTKSAGEWVEFRIYHPSNISLSDCGDPDMIVDDIWIRAGDGRLQARVKNQGVASAGDSSAAGFYIDGSARDFWLQVVDLAAGNSQTLTAPSSEFDCDTMPGSNHNIRVCADEFNDIAESNEGNNCRTETLSCGGSACTPATCASLGKSCGTWPDGCGGTINCGTCSGSTACGYGSCSSTQRPSWYCDNGTCRYNCSYSASCDTCTPATCASLGKSCGTWPDGCGGTINCGGCSGSTDCDYGSCDADERPSWYCDNGTCRYNCSYSASCGGTTVCEECVSALPSEANYFANVGEQLTFYVKNPQSGITYSFGGAGDCSCSNCSQCRMTAGSIPSGLPQYQHHSYTGIGYANGSYLGSADVYVCDYGLSYANSSNAYNLTPAINSSKTKAHMCSRNSQGIYYKVIIPSGYQCDLSWTINYGIDAGGHYKLYTRSSGVPSSGSYDCMKDVQRSTAISGTCSYNGLSFGTYYAYVNYAWGASAQIEGNTRPQADYSLRASISCSSGGSSSWYPCDPSGDTCSNSNACGQRIDAPIMVTTSEGTVTCPSGNVVTGQCVPKNSDDYLIDSYKNGNGWYCKFGCSGWFCTANGCGYVQCQ